MALISMAKSDVKFSASPYKGSEGDTVVIRADDNFYPLAGIHLSVDEAIDLARQIQAAISSFGGAK